MLISNTVGDVSRETSPTSSSSWSLGILNQLLPVQLRIISHAIACSHAGGEGQQAVADHPSLQTR